MTPYGHCRIKDVRAEDLLPGDVLLDTRETVIEPGVMPGPRPDRVQVPIWTGSRNAVAMYDPSTRLSIDRPNLTIHGL